MQTKIALPTDDGFLLCCECRFCRGFQVVTLEGSKIISSETRWNLLSEILTSTSGFYYNLTDCDTVILKDTQKGMGKKLAACGKKVSYSEEMMINEALKSYIHNRNVVHA